MRGLYWVRNDLRLHDNITLRHFCRDVDEALFLWAPSASYQRSGLFRREFIDNNVAGFQAMLSSFQQAMILSSNVIREELAAVIQHYKIQKVFFTQEFAFDEVQDEKFVKDICQSLGVAVESFDQGALIHEKDLPFSLSEMPFIFTDFRKKVEGHLRIRPVMGPPERWPKAVMTAPYLNQNADSRLKPSGEELALKRMSYYFNHPELVTRYKETRNGLMDEDDSTKFSPWLSLGLLSLRKIYDELQNAEEKFGANDSTYWVFFELLWRDYFKFFSRRYGASIFKLEGLRKGGPDQIISDPSLFASWCEGKTSDDFINANMNELNQTGWMSNRGRQNVASYLIHDLQLPWVWGAAYFEKMLIDYDPDLNWGNWLYLSGRGSDPRARRFNTQKQAEQYDPVGSYRKKWLVSSGQ